MTLAEMIERVKQKMIGRWISTADYEDNAELIASAVRATLESLGPVGLGLDGTTGELYDLNKTKPRDDRNAHWSGGRKRR